MLGIIQKEFLTKIAEKDKNHRGIPPEVFYKVDILLQTLQDSQEEICIRVSFLTKLQIEALQPS